MPGPRKLITYCVGVPVPRSSSFVPSPAAARSSLSLSGIKVTAIPSGALEESVAGTISCVFKGYDDYTGSPSASPIQESIFMKLVNDQKAASVISWILKQQVQVIKSQLKIYVSSRLES